MIIFGFILAGFVLFWEAFKSRKGEVFETYHFQTEQADLRVTARHEFSYIFMLIPGAYYDFEGKRKTDKEWTQIYTFRHDDPIEIPKTQIRKEGEDIIYAFMGWVLISTDDGGKSWDIWDAWDDLEGWEGVNYSLIKDVIIKADGSARMILDPIGNRTQGTKELESEDFGKTWKKVDFVKLTKNW